MSIDITKRRESLLLHRHSQHGALPPSSHAVPLPPPPPPHSNRRRNSHTAGDDHDEQHTHERDRLLLDSRATGNENNHSSIYPAIIQQQHQAEFEAETKTTNVDGADADADTGTPADKPKFSFRKISQTQAISLALVLLCGLFWSVVFACIGPFFTNEALAKGATPSQIGLIFGIFELAGMICTPIWGRLVPRMGARRMFLVGVFITATSNAAYGLLQWAPPGMTFVVLCMFLRIVEGIGGGAFGTGSFPILARQFPDHIASVLGFQQTFISVGFMVGPFTGSLLYTLGGFPAPFFVLGALGLFGFAIGCIYLPEITYEVVEADGENKKSSGNAGYFRVLSIPLAALTCFARIIALLGVSFLDAMLAPHLSTKFHLSVILIGVWLLIGGACEVTLAPTIGYILDSRYWHVEFMCVGSLIGAAAFLLIGPAPFLQEFIPTGSLLISIFAQILVGIAIAFTFIPPSSLLLLTCRQHKLVETAELHGTLGGLIALTKSIGCFVGPFGGGYLVQAIAFEWTATVIAALFAGAAVLWLLPLGGKVFKSLCRKRNYYEKI